MAQATLQLLCDRLDGRVVLRSPGVGNLTAVPRRGRLLGEGDVAGVLETLGVTRPLLVPSGVVGRVENNPPDRVHQPVGYGDILFELSPIGASDATAPEVSDEASTSGPILRAPYSGRFWHRPSPADPSFITVGDRVESGATLGLLEVMKTFTHLTYPDDGSLPSPARITAILVEDGAEVGEGDPLIEVEA